MTTGGHAFTTWCVAHLLHPIIWIIGVIITNNGLRLELDLIFPVCIMALIASIPAMLVFWGIIELIINASFSPLKKLVIWGFSAPLIVCANALLFMLLMTNGILDKDIFRTAFCVISPSVMATVLAVLIRCQQFLKLNAEIVSRKALAQNESANPAIKA